ncbi:MAG: tetratricopeptide repeat protein [Candidatus Acidiferrales bacterium]
MARSTLRICLLCLVGAALCAGVAAQVAPQRPPETRLPSGASLYSIEGRVTAEDEFTPIRNVRVTLYDFRGAARGTQHTDDQGAFAFYGLPSGTYKLTTRHRTDPEQTFEVDVSFSPRRDVRLALSSRRAASPPAASSARPLPAWVARIPDRARKCYDAGMRAFAAGKYKESQAHFEEATELFSGYASAHSALGAALLAQKKQPEAAAAFAAALKVDPHLLEACMALGSLHNAKKEFAEAQPLLLTARRLRASDWRIHFQLAEAFMGLADWLHAEESLRETARLHPEAPARVYLLLINSLVRQDKYPEALAAMDSYLKRFPEDPFAKQVRTKRDALRKDLERAAAHPPWP